MKEGVLARVLFSLWKYGLSVAKFASLDHRQWSLINWGLGEFRFEQCLLRVVYDLFLLILEKNLICFAIMAIWRFNNQFEWLLAWQVLLINQLKRYRVIFVFCRALETWGWLWRRFRLFFTIGKLFARMQFLERERALRQVSCTFKLWAALP